MTTATAAKTTAKTTAPSDRALKRDVIAWTLKTAVDAFTKLPTKTVKGQKLVTVDGRDIPHQTALYAIKQTFGYIPSDIWDSRLGARDVGRPVTQPATKTSAPKTSAPAPVATPKTATTKRTATKTTPATATRTTKTATSTAPAAKTAPAKTAPKTAPAKTAAKPAATAAA